MKSALMNWMLSLRQIYWRVFQPATRGVRAVLVNERGEIFLVKHSYGAGWYLPGGRVNRNEDDLVALRRELLEETGIRFDAPNKRLGVYLNEQEHKKDTIAVFVFDASTVKGSADIEIEAGRFFSPASLPEDVSPGTKRRIEEWLGKRTVTDKW